MVWGAWDVEGTIQDRRVVEVMLVCFQVEPDVK
jgi:hypothetical protein